LGRNSWLNGDLRNVRSVRNKKAAGVREDPGGVIVSDIDF